MEQMRVDCYNLDYSYAGHRGSVFDDLTFALAGSGFHALFGPSGVGKTTLARMLAGLLPPHRGQILARDMGPVLYTCNTEQLPGWCSVGRHLRETAVNGDAVAELARGFGLEACLNERFEHLSLGQQNRINLMRYLLQEFDLLIMDESLSNVDEASRRQILLQIKQLFSQKMFLYISHNVLEVARFCDQILVLRGLPRQPQVVSVQGCDEHAADRLALEAMQPVMLELLHAA